MKKTIPTLSEQMRDGNLFAEQCPSREVLKHVTSRWGVLILLALRGGTHRFSELRHKMGGVSEKMLSQSLQALEQDGFVDRVSYPAQSPLPAQIHLINREPDIIRRNLLHRILRLILNKRGCLIGR